MKLKISFSNHELSATLLDTAAGKSFAAMLPLTLEVEDYARAEKIAYLPKKLDTKNSAVDYEPTPGTITLYAPWGNLAMFYKSFSPISDLIKLGQLDSRDVAKLASIADGTEVTFSL